MEEKGEAVLSSATTQAQPVVLEQTFTMEGDTHKSCVSCPTTPLDHHDEDQRVARTVGCATAPTKAATGQEAAGAQAVKRGCPVRLEEVLDKDDMSFKIWQKANLNPPVEPEVTQLMVAGSIDPSMKTEKVPSEWLKPFSAKWTL